MLAVISLFPQQASAGAKSVDLLYLYLIAVSGFFALLIFSLVFYFALRYRRRSEDERPKPIRGSSLLEIAWIGIPLLLTLTMFGWGAKLFFNRMTAPPDALEIFVVGKQWMWKIQHPEGPREINELHIPVGKPIRLTMTSEDVIHSFYVPAFRTKMDVVPGRYTSTWFKATKPGSYHLFCAEYCGTKHAAMGGHVIVMKETDYERWLARASSGGTLEEEMGEDLVSRGKRYFHKYRCFTCHHEGALALGARLDGLYGSTVHLADGRTVTANDAYIRESILKPKAKVVKGYDAIMPTYQGQITEEEILAIIEYLKTKDKKADNADKDT